MLRCVPGNNHLVLLSGETFAKELPTQISACNIWPTLRNASAHQYGEIQPEQTKCPHLSHVSVTKPKSKPSKQQCVFGRSYSWKSRWRQAE